MFLFVLPVCFIMAYVYVHVICIYHIHLYIELPSKIYLLFCYAIARGNQSTESTERRWREKLGWFIKMLLLSDFFRYGKTTKRNQEANVY